MIAALTKRVEEVGPADLLELIGWPESENVEYKRELHQPQPWSARGELTDSSKKKIFKELVAFANTSGGRLFIGISETTGGGPPRASAIQPIPRCVDLATRLEQALIASIDPPFTFLRAIGVPTNGDGGVVIVDVPASYSGPHRSSDLHCYGRKGTHSIPMGMREIQDIVIRLSRRQDEIRDRLIERRDLFQAWAPKGVNTQVAIRVTALPVSAPLYLDPVFKNRAVSNDLGDVSGDWIIGPSELHLREKFPSPYSSLSERRVLGGTAWTRGPSEHAAKQVILRNGLVDVWFKSPWYAARSGATPRSIFPLGWVINLSANALLRVCAFREAAQSPACEYALQLELRSISGPGDCPIQMTVPGLGGGLGEDFGSAFETPVILGPYAVGDREDVMNLIVRDLYDASGEHSEPSILEIDWPS